MNTVELIHYSLGFAFETLDELVSDLTQEQADWMPPGNAIPIGSLYWHTIKYVDQIVHQRSRAAEVNVCVCLGRQLHCPAVDAQHVQRVVSKVIGRQRIDDVPPDPLVPLCLKIAHAAT